MTLKTIGSKVVYCLTFSQEVLPQFDGLSQRQGISGSVSGTAAASWVNHINYLFRNEPCVKLSGSRDSRCRTTTFYGNSNRKGCLGTRSQTTSPQGAREHCRYVTAPSWTITQTRPIIERDNDGVRCSKDEGKTSMKSRCAPKPPFGGRSSIRSAWKHTSGWKGRGLRAKVNCGMKFPLLSRQDRLCNTYTVDPRATTMCCLRAWNIRAVDISLVNVQLRYALSRGSPGGLWRVANDASCYDKCVLTVSPYLTIHYLERLPHRRPFWKVRHVFFQPTRSPPAWILVRPSFSSRMGAWTVTTSPRTITLLALSL